MKCKRKPRSVVTDTKAYQLLCVALIENAIERLNDGRRKGLVTGDEMVKAKFKHEDYEPARQAISFLASKALERTLDLMSSNIDADKIRAKVGITKL